MHALARVAANPRVQAHLDASMDLLVQQARSLDYDQLVIVLARWESLADEHGTGDRNEKAHRNRNARLHLGDHDFQLDANGGTAAGVQIKEILDAFAQTEFLADWEAGVAEHGEGMCPGLLARTDAQRRADALLAVFLTAAGAGTGADAGGSTGSNVTVNLVMGYDRFCHHLHKALGGRPEAVDPLDPLELWQPCETADGHQIDPHDVLVAAAMGHVRRVVVDSAGVVVDAGRKQRLFTGALRELVLMSSPRCCWPGCHRPASQCEADHMLPYATAGPTRTGNGAPTCGHHNRWRTRGYLTRRDEHGHWHHHRPDNTEIGWRAHTAPLGDLATPGPRVQRITFAELLAG
ncbi:MAG: HNH endonuclease signature motif containing protein, partial [Ilumatobacteraceae bacterium]